ncbi:hypothetical protein NEHOM01_2541, partial [Nematocida homosporus]|uniref:uncharacterized protein n=1 Tax=Nematocida homosporus TaxID=1912981 RepID=UPI00221F5D0F
MNTYCLNRTRLRCLDRSRHLANCLIVIVVGLMLKTCCTATDTRLTHQEVVALLKEIFKYHPLETLDRKSMRPLSDTDIVVYDQKLYSVNTPTKYLDASKLNLV